MDEQLRDILTFRPKTKPKKDILSSVEKTSNDKVKGSSGTALTQLMANSPSSAIKDGELAVDACEVLMSHIEKDLKNNEVNGVSFNDYKTALNNDNYPVIDKYEDGHFNSIEGSSSAELYGSLHYMKKQMNEMLGMIVENNYKDVDSKSFSKQDKEIFDVMIQLEEDGSDQLNYSAISIDTQVNAGMRNYFANCIDFVESSTSIVDKKPNRVKEIDNTKTVVSSFLKYSFESENHMNNHDRKKLRQMENSKIRKQVASTMYANRNRLLESQQVLDDILSIKEDSLRENLLQNHDKNRTKSEIGILDFYKTNSMEKMYRSDFVKTIGRKQIVRQTYSQQP